MPTLLELFSNKNFLGMNSKMDTYEKEVDAQIKKFKDDNVASDGTNIPGPIRYYNTVQIKGGKTAAFIYDIKNRPLSKIDTSNIFLKYTSFPIVNKLRTNPTLASKDSQTVVESEVTGLRPLQLFSEPVLYGTQILTINKQQSNSVRKMNLGTMSFEEAQEAKILNPKKYTPSNLWLLNDFRTGKIEEYPKLFSKLKGTPNLLLNLLTKPVSTVKSLVREAILPKQKASSPIPSRIPENLPDDAYSKKVDKTNADEYERNDLGSKLVTWEVLQNLTLGPDGFVTASPKKKEKIKYSDSRNEIIKNLQIEDKRGIKDGSDIINSKGVYTPSEFVNNTLELKDKTILDDYDFITLKFFSVQTRKAANFRATINGLSETFTPTWESSKFVGNPFNFYTYSGVERSVTFNFIVYSLNDSEHIAAWQRLSFLSSLAYSQGFINNYSIPPFIKFTLGDMYKNKPAFIESLTYTVPDDSTWEIGLGQESNRYANGTIYGQTIENKNTKDAKLPKVIEVAITLKLVESQDSVYEVTTVKDSNGAEFTEAKENKNLYGYKSTLLPPKPTIQANGADKNVDTSKDTDNTSKAGALGSSTTDNTNGAKFKPKEDSVLKDSVTGEPSDVPATKSIKNDSEFDTGTAAERTP
jgi:hypothetical protein